jgi:hypothetical protein
MRVKLVKAQDKTEVTVHIDTIMDIAQGMIQEKDLNASQTKEVKDMIFDDVMSKAKKLADTYDSSLEKVLKMMIQNEGTIEKIVTTHIGHVVDDKATDSLWENIHAKRKRIQAGSKERMKRPGEKGRPTDQDFKDAAKTSKK